ncbi:MAG TPA: hypothetical protein VM888_08250, partial [Chitinophagaceae bacterium]|nr:hypothetical protein [Chitinophagaceae bacterium]
MKSLVTFLSFFKVKISLAPLIRYRLFSLLSILLFSFIQTTVQAQNGCIDNNSFEVRPAICSGTVALLQGSIPTGGNGTFTYQWEAGDGNCGDGSFVPIPGATGRDYAVPETADDDACYRRVVKSGSCRVESGKNKVSKNEQSPPVPPAVSVIQPTCTIPTGTITIASPAL